MTEREKLIDELEWLPHHINCSKVLEISDSICDCFTISVKERIADFILKDRARIVDPLVKALRDAIDTIRQMPDASFIPRRKDAKQVDIITSHQLANRYDETLKLAGAGKDSLDE
jgi:hypothetical protein